MNKRAEKEICICWNSSNWKSDAV